MYIYKYHSELVEITMSHCDFGKATLISFCKITVAHHDFRKGTVIPETHYIRV